MGMVKEGKWVWEFGWKRIFNNVEFVEFVDLWLCLCRVFIRPGLADSIAWNSSRSEIFTTKEMYTILHNSRQSMETTPNALKDIWHKCIPCKVSSFVWKALQDRIPTRENLLKRRIFLENNCYSCPLCPALFESTDHILISCAYSNQVWKAIYKWLNFSYIPQSSILDHFCEFVEKGGNKVGKAICTMIWQCACWKIWKFRNAKVFKDESSNSSRTVDEIIFCTWRWLKAKNPNHFYYSSFEWMMDPVSCFPTKIA
ncbi:uncharacterized protein LOC130990529 [Salvia miltiorrhiza]|uniref:uncharacterized protein LOC130990529 n=2 Tax=Salvia miltiorrhiza TaxID=226208 RepID=UPI0025AC18EC|nr:uncharacterized protein LOC130990529 [Salvia miltiorrhiza]